MLPAPGLHSCLCLHTVPVCGYNILFVHSTFGRLGCFHSLVIVNSAAVKCLYRFNGWNQYCFISGLSSLTQTLMSPLGGLEMLLPMSLRPSLFTSTSLESREPLGAQAARPQTRPPRRRTAAALRHPRPEIKPLSCVRRSRQQVPLLRKI